MIAFLLANWKSIAAAGAAFALSLMLHKLDVDRIEARHEKQIASLRIAMTEACSTVQETTRKVSHDYQKNLADLNARLSDARQLHDSACVAVTGIPSSGYDDAAKLGKSSGKAAEGARSGASKNLSARYLIDLTGEGEKYRLQLLACQAFVSATGKAR